MRSSRLRFRPRAASLLLAIFAVAGILPLTRLTAQGSPGATAAVGSSTAPTTGARRALNLEEYGRWQRISGTSITADGKWMMYTLTPNEGGGPVLHIKPIDSGSEITITLGGGGGGGRGAAAGGGGGGGGGAAVAGRWHPRSLMIRSG